MFCEPFNALRNPLIQVTQLNAQRDPVTTPVYDGLHIEWFLPPCAEPAREGNAVALKLISLLQGTASWTECKAFCNLKQRCNIAGALGNGVHRARGNEPWNDLAKDDRLNRERQSDNG